MKAGKDEQMGDVATITQPTISAEIMEMVVGTGDLAKLTSRQRVDYLGAVCQSLGLNPLTQPLAFQNLGGKVVMYARKEATDQLRRIHNVNIQVISREVVGDLLIVTVRGTTRDGRSDESIGAVSVAGLRGEAAANAAMKAETKAKRRVTLSLCGLGVMDEMEFDAVQNAETMQHPGISGVIPAGDEPIDVDFKKAMDAFAELKRQIGAERYYRVLGSEGFEHANEIKKAADRRRIYLMLKDEAKLNV